MLKELKSKDVPVDGIGFQMHIKSSDHEEITREHIADLISSYGELGLEVHITELDIEICERVDGTQTICVPDEASLQQQAKLYADMLAACYIDNPGVCTAFLTWGIYDGLTWLDSDGGKFYPLLFDEDFEKKPAYDAITELLKSTAGECSKTTGLPQIRQDTVQGDSVEFLEDQETPAKKKNKKILKKIKKAMAARRGDEL